MCVGPARRGVCVRLGITPQNVPGTVARGGVEHWRHPLLQQHVLRAGDGVGDHGVLAEFCARLRLVPQFATFPAFSRLYAFGERCPADNGCGHRHHATGWRYVVGHDGTDSGANRFVAAVRHSIFVSRVRGYHSRPRHAGGRQRPAVDGRAPGLGIWRGVLRGGCACRSTCVSCVVVLWHSHPHSHTPSRQVCFAVPLRTQTVRPHTGCCTRHCWSC